MSNSVQHLFHICISSRNCQEVLDAIDNGIITGETVYQQFTLLHIAAANGRLPVVKAILNKGCDVKKRGSVSLIIFI